MITLRIAHCPVCHSTKATVPPDDVGACPYCPAPVPVAKTTGHRLWPSILTGLVLGALIAMAGGWR